MLIPAPQKNDRSARVSAVAADLVVVLAASVAQRRPPPRQQGFGGPRATGPATELSGTVKWYNPTKGFGFIMAEDGGKDVFIHRSVLMRANLPDLVEGQQVRMGVVEGQKGREAATIEI